MQQAKFELQEANATKDKFFSIIAHDLRSPFTALIGLAELMVKRFDRYSHDELHELAEEIQKSAENIYTLIENLLTWSRVQRGTMEYVPATIKLYEIARHNLLLMRAGAAQKQITLQNQIPEDLDAYADHNMVDTILRNLLSNALKFTYSGGTVQVSATTDHQFVSIAVTDTGAGIPAEQIPGLFRIDVRHSRAGTAGEKGTGLGLILCYELVKKHGGDLRVQSTVGKGSTFTFTLPAVPVNT